MTVSAPRLDSRLVAAIERLDDPTAPIAETNRRVGEIAEAIGFARPSYEQVRTIVHEARRRGRRPGPGEILLDVALRSRPPIAFGDYVAGTLPPDTSRVR
jgi:hypothetical protein